MEYEHKGEDGKIKRYETSYSQTLQKEIAKQIRVSNYLKYGLICIGLILLILFLLIYSSGVVDTILSRVLC